MTSAMAQSERSTGQLKEAESHYREALEIYQHQNREDHHRVATALDSLGWVLMEQWRFDEAEVFLQKGLDIRIANYGKGDPKVAMSLKSVENRRRRKRQELR